MTPRPFRFLRRTKVPAPAPAGPYRTPAPREPSLVRNPAAKLVAVSLFAAVVGALAACLTPAQLAADGPAIEAGMAAACPAANLIPVAGVFIAAACEGEEAAAEVAAADAGAPQTPSAARAKLRPLYGPRRRRVVGYAPAHLCDAAQRHLDAMADAGSPVTVVALPQAPAVLPLVSPADAGKDGVP